MKVKNQYLKICVPCAVVSEKLGSVLQTEQNRIDTFNK